MRFVEVADERFNKGIRIRYKVFNESEFTETKILCRNTVCANIKQSRIITIPKIDAVKTFRDKLIVNYLSLFRIGWTFSRIHALYFKYLLFKKKAKLIIDYLR